MPRKRRKYDELLTQLEQAASEELSWYDLTGEAWGATKWMWGVQYMRLGGPPERKKEWITMSFVLFRKRSNALGTTRAFRKEFPMLFRVVKMIRYAD